MLLHPLMHISSSYKNIQQCNSTQLSYEKNIYKMCYKQQSY